MHETAYGGAMNQTQSYMDTQHAHMSTGSSYAPQSQTAGLPHYTQYPPQTSNAYAPTQSTYSHYYGGVTSPQSAGGQVSVNTQLLPLPAMTSAHPTHTYGTANSGHGQAYPQGSFDSTGQVAPPGAKPRVTATLWEDEGSLCFQVEAKGVCVARREDNHFINGTKLLNVAGMTRGRRDGILKSEKTRHVVKIGPMHLKGVWIPYDRALEFSNREKITDLLYPLFVHNIGALLYHPTNSNRTNAVIDAANKRRAERGPQGALLANSATPGAGLHHHHSMSGQMPSQIGQPGLQSLAQHQHSATAGRPNLERSHTFPTPPTSASSVMGSQGNSYEWSQQSMSGSVQPSQALAIDTGLSNARSLPNTPATTPPGNSIPNMSYQSQQSYDKPVYSAAPQQQSQYATQQHNMARFGHPVSNPYVKNDMGPPSRATGSTADGDHTEIKQDPYGQQSAEQINNGTGDAEADHDTDYRGSYSYNTGGVMNAIHSEQTHLSPEQISGSPHQNGSGRVTPRNTTVPQAQWSSGYNTPPRTSQTSGLYNSSVADGRSAVVNGHSVAESYASSGYTPAAVNGTKRGREDDDLDYKTRGGNDIESLKRRRSGRENSIGAISAYDQSQLSRTGNTIIPRLR